MSDNMKLWDQVCTTDPKLTKKVKQRGGYTNVDAQSQLKRATEMFGPYGVDWGMRDEQWHTQELGTSKEGDVIWWIRLDAEFYYPAGRFNITVDMPLTPNNDCCKKLRTELRSKALSTIGFNSDVYEGKFDDMKYVEDVQQTLEHDKFMKDLIGRAKNQRTKEQQTKVLDYLQKLLSQEKITEDEAKLVTDAMPSLGATTTDDGGNDGV